MYNDTNDVFSEESIVKTLLRYKVIKELMMKSYRCNTCDKEIIDKGLAYKHKRTTGHKLLKRSFGK
ncbi:hypothetical protein DYY65_08675 [Nitrososphaera sp. AFS]|nr:hypothetical protein [Nitrososphaera sp. AFS]